MTLQMPYNEDAEKALLSSLLIFGDALKNIRLAADDFFLEKHRTIYESMQRLVDKRVAVDYLSLGDDLRSRGKLAEVGGEAYITELASYMPYGGQVETYAGIIREYARRRRVILIARDLTVKAFDTGSELDAVIADAGSRLFGAVVSEGQAHPLAEVMSDLLDQIMAAVDNPRDYYGIPTGMVGFDRITGGLQTKEVFMLSGEPGVGKSFLAMQLGIGAAEGTNGVPGTPGAVYQLEMSEIAVARRAVSWRSKVPTRAMRTGRINDYEITQIMAHIDLMRGLPIYISDYPQMTTVDLRADLARLKSHGIGWCIIDYMALLKDAPDQPETERMGIVSDRVHDIAKELDIHVMAIHDMTKGAQTGQVTGQAGLAGHRRVGYNADMTAFLRKTADQNIFVLEWEKFREDSAGRSLQLRRVPGFPAYAELEQ